MDRPDPLEPGHIPGQNSDTPERLPGSNFQKRRWRAGWIAAGVAAAVIVGYALLLSGALSSGQAPVDSPQNSKAH
ncbi:MAG TPA: hypothetical protein VHE81_20720 [Lacipirellulaceae bacterium]|nr:hypothetical protein [Lacipirellulaceae bacterium]